MIRWLAALLIVVPALVAQAAPPAAFIVQRSMVTDEKAVFATIESAHVVPARVRTAGTILELKVREGDRVGQGQVIALVGDQKLALEVKSSQARVQAAEAQLGQARIEFNRAQQLVATGAISRNAFDQARTAFNVAESNLAALIAQRAVIEQQQAEGQVLAPTSGRVITVPVTAGTVAMAGDTVATVAEQNFVLRLEIPERHARFLHDGDPVRLDGADPGPDGPRFGTIRLIYPQVRDGRVTADATVPGLADYFVGERVQVWIPAGSRPAIIVPAGLITTRFGIDYARVWTQEAGAIAVPVQRGERRPTQAMPDGLEILSGLAPGDRLLAP